MEMSGTSRHGSEGQCAQQKEEVQTIKGVSSALQSNEEFGIATEISPSSSRQVYSSEPGHGRGEQLKEDNVALGVDLTGQIEIDLNISEEDALEKPNPRIEGDAVEAYDGDIDGKVINHPVVINLDSDSGDELLGAATIQFRRRRGKEGQGKPFYNSHRMRLRDRPSKKIHTDFISLGEYREIGGDLCAASVRKSVAPSPSLEQNAGHLSRCWGRRGRRSDLRGLPQSEPQLVSPASAQRVQATNLGTGQRAATPHRRLRELCRRTRSKRTVNGAQIGAQTGRRTLLKLGISAVENNSSEGVERHEESSTITDRPNAARRGFTRRVLQSRKPEEEVDVAVLSKGDDMASTQMKSSIASQFGTTAPLKRKREEGALLDEPLKCYPSSENGVGRSLSVAELCEAGHSDSEAPPVAPAPASAPGAPTTLPRPFFPAAGVPSKAFPLQPFQACGDPRLSVMDDHVNGPFLRPEAHISAQPHFDSSQYCAAAGGTSSNLMILDGPVNIYNINAGSNNNVNDYVVQGEEATAGASRPLSAGDPQDFSTSSDGRQSSDDDYCPPHGSHNSANNGGPCTAPMSRPRRHLINDTMQAAVPSKETLAIAYTLAACANPEIPIPVCQRGLNSAGSSLSLAAAVSGTAANNAPPVGNLEAAIQELDTDNPSNGNELSDTDGTGGFDLNELPDVQERPKKKPRKKHRPKVFQEERPPRARKPKSEGQTSNAQNSKKASTGRRKTKKTEEDSHNNETKTKRKTAPEKSTARKKCTTKVVPSSAPADGNTIHDQPCGQPCGQSTSIINADANCEFNGLDSYDFAECGPNPWALAAEAGKGMQQNNEGLCSMLQMGILRQTANQTPVVPKSDMGTPGMGKVVNDEIAMCTPPDPGSVSWPAGPSGQGAQSLRKQGTNNLGSASDAVNLQCKVRRGLFQTQPENSGNGGQEPVRIEGPSESNPSLTHGHSELLMLGQVGNSASEVPSLGPSALSQEGGRGECSLQVTAAEPNAAGQITRTIKRKYTRRKPLNVTEGSNPALPEVGMMDGVTVTGVQASNRGRGRGAGPRTNPRSRKPRDSLTLVPIENQVAGVALQNKITGLELVPCVPQQTALVPYYGPIVPLKPRKLRAKVMLDEEDKRLWKMVMAKGTTFKDANEDPQAKKWEEERATMKMRAEMFISRMHLVQGDRRFSPWKGSVLDSVVGAFLTQNVSDHLSSSSFMFLAARFPVTKEKKEAAVAAAGAAAGAGAGAGAEAEAEAAAAAEIGGTSVEEEAVKEAVEIYEMFSNMSNSPNSTNAGEGFQGGPSFRCEDALFGTEKSSGSGDGALICGNDQQNHGPPSTREPDVHCGNEQAVQIRDETIDGKTLQGLRVIDSSSNCDKSSIGSTDAGEQHNSSPSSISSRNQYSNCLQVTTTVRTMENLEVVRNSQEAPSIDVDKFFSSQFGAVCPPSNLISDGYTASQEPMVCGSTPTSNETPPANAAELGGLQLVVDLTLENERLPQEPFGEDLTPSTRAPPEVSEISQKKAQISAIAETWSQIVLQQQEQTPPPALGDMEDTSTDGDSATPGKKKTVRSLHLWKNQARKNVRKTELQKADPNVDNVSVVKSTLEVVNISTTTDLEKKVTNPPKISYIGLTGIELARAEQAKITAKDATFDWEALRLERKKQHQSAKNGEGQNIIAHKNESDSPPAESPSSSSSSSSSDPVENGVDWDAVRAAELEEIAAVIRDRGMNNILAGRIKAFLERLAKEHGSLDLEWLRTMSVEEAKAFLLSIRGLGLKSVECIRLLTLHHLAFPVDTNVGRICVRLGWVPLEPLPEELELHRLELYPIQATVQKYLWPRLCNLDQKTLYELHYQLITFGKVFCTKSKPNCGACPMRDQCQHFQSAVASSTSALPNKPHEGAQATPQYEALALPPSAVEFLEKAKLSLPAAVVPPSNEGARYREEEPRQQQPQQPSCEPIIEEPSTPDGGPSLADMEDFVRCAEIEEEEVETFYGVSSQPSCETDMEVETVILPPTIESPDVPSKALILLPPGFENFAPPLLKEEDRLRTVHFVYELPDNHHLLEKMDPREPDDPSFYLLAMWGKDEKPDSPPELDDEKTNGVYEKGLNPEGFELGTLLVPTRTAMRGKFPLNGTYFQVNEMFADHATSIQPILVPRASLWKLRRRHVIFGTSVSTMLKGLRTSAIQHVFWHGYVCVRAFDQATRNPRPLAARLHSALNKTAKRGKGGKPLDPDAEE